MDETWGVIAEAEMDALVARLRARIGKRGARCSRRIGAGAPIKFARATGQTDPLLIDEEAARLGPHGAAIAAPTCASTFCAELMGDGLIETDVPFNMFLHTVDDARVRITLWAREAAGELVASGHVSLVPVEPMP